MGIRGITRELGIHRDTVRKYMNAESVHLCLVPAQRRKCRNLLAWQTTERTFSLDT